MIYMYDSISPQSVPSFASTAQDAVAGYVGGHWPDFTALEQRFPRDHHLSIAVNAEEDADCLDVETGDARPDQAPSWVRRQHGRGVARPVLYANLSTMPAVQSALDDAGIPRGAVRLWVAHYDGVAEVPAGFDAKQFRSTAAYDESVCLDNFFSAKPARHAAPKKPSRRPHPVKRVSHVTKKVAAKAAPHRKAVGGSAATSVALLVTELLQLYGIQIDPQVTAAISSAAALLGALLTPASKAS